MDDLYDRLGLFLRRFLVELILLAIAAVIGIFSYAMFLQENKETSPLSDSENISSLRSPDIINKIVTVDVAGAVTHEGVYELRVGSRLKDAVEAAGGITDEADTDYFRRNFNQSRYVTDQEKIYIPNVQEISNGTITERKQYIDYLTPRTVSSVPSYNPFQQLPVNINTADQAELEGLPGVGEVTAKKIIELRPFSSVEELLEKQVVKKNVYEQIKNSVTL